MAARIDDTLQQRFAAAGEGHIEVVVVCLRREATVAQLERVGMAPTWTSRDGRILVASIDATTLDALAGDDDVVSVEPDGEVRALDT